MIVKVFDLTAAKTGLSEKEALAEGITPLVTYVVADHHAGYYPGAKPIRIKTVADKQSGRLLGAQIIGEEGVDKRIDVMATAIYNRMKLEDLTQLDLAHAPPCSSARDPVMVAGAVGQNYYAGDWVPITGHQLHDKIMAGDELTIVDLRSARDLKDTGMIPGARHIPVDELRGRLAEFDPSREIVLYCGVGLRSYIIARVMAMKGFKNVKALTGGFACWTYTVTREGV